MADKNDSGDKTEAPTQKRIADARKKGDVAKSKDLTSVAGLLVWLMLVSFGAAFAGNRLAALFNTSFDAVARGLPFATAWADIGSAAVQERKISLPKKTT